MDKTLWNKAIKTAVGNMALCGNLLETIDKNMAQEFTEKFENCVNEYCKLDIKHNSTLEVLEQTKQYYLEEESDKKVPAKKIFEKYFKEIEEPEDEDVANHDLRKAYNHQMKGGESSSNKTMEDDVDIISTNEFVPPIDPISKEPIKNPVRNVNCGHIYERDTISQMIEQKKKMKCPYIGCPSKQYVSMDNLESDHQVKRKIEQYFLNM